MSQPNHSVVDKAFSQFFPRWNEMSALDPIKILAEGVGSSLQEVEKRQNELLDRVLDSLPALFSFTPKEARAPYGYFQMEPSRSLVKKIVIPGGTRLNFLSKMGEHLLELQETAELHPFSTLAMERDARNLRIRLSALAPLSTLKLWFFPKSNASGGAVLRQLSVQVQGKGVENFSAHEIKVSDSTQALSRAGEIQIEMPITIDKQPDKGRTDITLLFESSEEITGSFHTNLVKANHFSTKSNVNLASLQGTTWEEIPLPEQALSAPAELVLEYPDERTLVLQKIDTDILKIRRLNPEAYAQAFFYSASHHSVVLPNAHKLKKNFSGGVHVKAHEIDYAVPFDWFANPIPALCDSTTYRLEAVVPIQQLSPLVPRESTSSYLTRFYSMLREFSQSSERASTLFEKDLQARLLGCHPDLRAIEIEKAKESKAIKIFACVGHPSQPQALSKEIKGALQSQIEQILPLDYSWTLHPFYSTPMEVQLQAELGFGEERNGILGERALEARLAGITQNYFLPAPFGALKDGVPVPKSSLLHDLLRQLTASRVDNSHLRINEVKNLHGLIVHGDTSDFVEVLERRPGETFFLNVGVTASISTDSKKGLQYA